MGDGASLRALLVGSDLNLSTARYLVERGLRRLGLPGDHITTVLCDAPETLSAADPAAYDALMIVVAGDWYRLQTAHFQRAVDAALAGGTPVFAFTGRADAPDRAWLEERGIPLHVSPFPPGEVVAFLGRLVAASERRPAP